MKKIIIITLIVITILAIFFIVFNNKLFKNGNNINSKSKESIKQYILNINSYELTSNIIVESNKNSNKYVIKEKYTKENNIFKKEVIEPENIGGISFLYDGVNLRIDNSRIELVKLYKNYPYIGESSISFISFINDYKESQESNIYENEDEVILGTKIKNGNKYIAYKKLYVNKKDRKPIKLEVQDITQNTTIYILYNEIKINNLQKEEILAFKLKQITNDI